MTPPVRWHSQALGEVAEAALYYDLQLPGLGERFLEAADHAVHLAAAHPLRYRRVLGKARRIRVEPFAYQVVFLPGKDSVVVIAVAHASRKPGYWAERTES